MSTSTSFVDALRRLVVPHIPLSAGEISALDAHYSLLVRWNARINLTRVISPEESAVRHYGESLFLAGYITTGSVVDIGSGAGFPGIPAAIHRADCRFDLVESHKRKAVFLSEAARALPNVRILAERAETLESKYDWLVSRAVSPSELLGLELAPRMALLIGADDACELPGFKAVPLPWGERLVLAIRA